MNKLLYRLVFNRVRGQLMAVGESARGHAKSGAAADRSNAEMPAGQSSGFLRSLGAALGAAISMTSPGVAQVVADQGASKQQQATVTTAGNGVILVNVQRPSAAGVSRNVFSQFDVPQSGVVLNNAHSGVQSQLGGRLQGNANLRTGAARVILNEVNSADPSLLRGAIEVAGQRAEVVIANPAGIQVDGGSFINVSRATLTTGAPVLTNGALDGYRVQRGKVVVNGAGLDTRNTDYTNLIARSVEVNGNVWAKRLQVTAGANHVQRGDGRTTVLPGEGAAPQYGIDVSQLGGMYAQKIVLVGTEAGVGVRNAGTIGAGAGQLVVSSDGRLEHRDTAETSGSIHIESATDITNSGLVKGDADVTVVAGARIDNRGGTVEANRVVVDSTGRIDNRGGKLLQRGTGGLNIRSPLLRNSGGGRIGGAATSTAGVSNGSGVIGGAQVPLGRIQSNSAIDNEGGHISADGGIALTVERLDNNAGELRLDSLAVTGADFSNRLGRITVRDNFNARIVRFANEGGQIVVGGRFDGVMDSLDNARGLLDAGALRLDINGRLDNQDGLVRQSGAQNAWLKVAGEFFNGGGKLYSGGQLTLNAGSITGTGGELTTLGDLWVNSGVTSAANGKWIIGGSANVSSAAFNNDGGSIFAGKDLKFKTDAFLNRDGKVATSGHLFVDARGMIDSGSGAFQAGGNLQINALGSLNNDKGIIEALSAGSILGIRASGIENGSGRIANAGSGETVIGSDSHFVNNGAITGNGNLWIDAANLDNLASGTLSAGGDLSFAVARKINNLGGTISSGGAMYFRRSGVNLRNSGVIAAGGDISLTASQLDNQRGLIATRTGSRASIALTSQMLNNIDGRVYSDADLAVSAQTLPSLDGLYAGRDLALATAGDYSIATGTRIDAKRNLTLSVAGNLRNEGALTGSGTVIVRANQLDNALGALIQGQSIALSAAGSLRNAGDINGSSSVLIDAATIDNSKNIIGDDIFLKASVVRNAGPAALIGAKKSLTVSVSDATDNTGGATIYSGGSIAIAANQERNARGVLTAQAGRLNNIGSTIEAAGNLEIAAVSINNVRENIVIDKVTTVDETTRMRMPDWWKAGSNSARYDARSANYSAHEVYYVNPADVLENGSYVTPDGQTIGRALIRTHANDSAFSSAGSGLYGAYGHRERIAVGEGIRVIYYLASSTASNPDQVAGITTGVFVDEGKVQKWDTAGPAFSNAFGNCASNCLRLVTQAGYVDPGATLIRDGQMALAPRLDKLEIARDARHSVTEDRLRPGAGQDAQIRSGGNMVLTFDETLNNQYGTVASRGNYSSYGATGSTVNNVGMTLYATHRFDGKWYTAAGDATYYQRPDMSQVIGHIGGGITSNGAVAITTRDVNNVDMSAGSVGHVRDVINVVPSSAFAFGGANLPPVSRASALLAAPTGLLGLNQARGSGPLRETHAQLPASGFVVPADAGKARAPVQPGGAQISGKTVTINAVDIVNRGGVIEGSAGTSLNASNDLLNQGGKIAGRNVVLTAGRDLINQSLLAFQRYQSSTSSGSYTVLSDQGIIQSTENLIIEAARDVQSFGGTVSARSAASLSAGRDFSFNTLATGSSYNAQVNGSSTESQTTDHQLSSLMTGGDLELLAARDILLFGAQVSIGGGTIAAGRNIKLDAVLNSASSDQHDAPGSTTYDKQVSLNERAVGTSVNATGALTVRAGTGEFGSLSLQGGQVAAGGAVRLAASGDVNLTATTERHLSDQASHRESKNFASKRSSSSADYVATALAVGSSVSGNGISVSSGRDVNVVGSEITARDALQIAATRDLTLGGATGSSSERHSLATKRSGISFNTTDGVGYHSAARSSSGSADALTNSGSVLSGATVTAVSGRDVHIKGSTVVADKDVVLRALGDVSIVSSQETFNDTSASASKSSGMIGARGQAAVGTVKTTNAGAEKSTRQVGSQVASLGAGVSIIAGNQFIQTASQVLTPSGDIDIRGRHVLIGSAFSTNHGDNQSTYGKGGLGGSVQAPIITAVQSIRGMAESAGDTKSGRMRGLAAVTAAFQAKDALAGVANPANTAKKGSGIKISVSLGSSRAESDSVQSSSTVVGSQIKAGGDVRIVATGAGLGSNLGVVGSEITGAGNVLLAADNAIELRAEKNLASQHSTNKSSGASIGIGFAFGGEQEGFTLELAANKAKGNADGDSVNYSNSRVDSGKTLTLRSGGDTTLKGALVAGKAVEAEIGGDLHIESLQDHVKYDSKQASSGFSLSLCIPPFCYGASTGTVNASKTKVNGEFLSVSEQSGIRAGEDGFRVKVGGNTNLVGGVIASSQTAVDKQLNAMQTGTLTFSDLINRDVYNADSFAVSATVSGKSDGVGDLDANQTAKQASANGGKPSATAGIGRASGSQESVTHSAISGGVLTFTDSAGQSTIAKDLASLERNVASENANAKAGALVKAWDGQELAREVQAQTAITQAFSAQAPKEVAAYADRRRNNLSAAADRAAPEERAALLAEAEKWDEGGNYRAALHTFAGALGGGVGGAIGAGLVSKSSEALTQVQAKVQVALERQGMGQEAARVTAQGIAQVTSLGLGAAVGSASGAAVALSVDTNNRMLHAEDKLQIERLAYFSDGRFTEEQVRAALRYAGLKGENGKVVIPEGARETFLAADGKLANVQTGMSYLRTLELDPSIQLHVPEGAVLMEVAPVRPSNELMEHILAYTGGAKSPYLFTKGPSQGVSLETAPEGTFRMRANANGGSYYPLFVNCPAASCTNNAPLAYTYAESDRPTRDYLASLDEQLERDLNIVSLGGIGSDVVLGAKTIISLSRYARVVGGEVISALGLGGLRAEQAVLGAGRSIASGEVQYANALYRFDAGYPSTQQVRWVRATDEPLVASWSMGRSGYGSMASDIAPLSGGRTLLDSLEVTPQSGFGYRTNLVGGRVSSDSVSTVEIAGAGSAEGSTISLVRNKFPGEALDPNGKIFGEAISKDGRISIDGRPNLPKDVDFVITSDGRLVVGQKHTTLADKADVLAAGQMKLSGRGDIRQIDNLSGHYRPTSDEGLRVPEMLNKMGFKTTNSYFKLYDFTVDSNGFVTKTTLTVNRQLK